MAGPAVPEAAAGLGEGAKAKGAGEAPTGAAVTVAATAATEDTKVGAMVVTVVVVAAAAGWGVIVGMEVGAPAGVMAVAMEVGATAALLVAAVAGQRLGGRSRRGEEGVRRSLAPIYRVGAGSGGAGAHDSL